jgi:hypothetical protein
MDLCGTHDCGSHSQLCASCAEAQLCRATRKIEARSEKWESFLISRRRVPALPYVRNTIEVEGLRFIRKASKSFARRSKKTSKKVGKTGFGVSNVLWSAAIFAASLPVCLLAGHHPCSEEGRGSLKSFVFKSPF